MKIVIGADSAGKPLLDVVAKHLSGKTGVEVTDVSVPLEGEPEFYARTADRAAAAIVEGTYDRGILFCGTGIGVCISANKVPGIRAALTHDTYSAGKAATSNNAQIITLGARVVGPELAKAIVDTWLASTFDKAGASASNVAAIDALDDKYSKPAA
jgi:ribose 5-phosphate isomerase B